MVTTAPTLADLGLRYAQAARRLDEALTRLRFARTDHLAAATEISRSNAAACIAEWAAKLQARRVALEAIHDQIVDEAGGGVTRLIRPLADARLHLFVALMLCPYLGRVVVALGRLKPVLDTFLGDLLP